MLRLHSDLVSISAGDGSLHKLFHWIRDKAFPLYVKETRGRLHTLLVRLPQVRGSRPKHRHLCVPHGCTNGHTVNSDSLSVSDTWPYYLYTTFQLLVSRNPYHSFCSIWILTIYKFIFVFYRRTLSSISVFNSIIWIAMKEVGKENLPMGSTQMASELRLQSISQWSTWSRQRKL